MLFLLEVSETYANKSPNGSYLSKDGIMACKNLRGEWVTLKRPKPDGKNSPRSATALTL